MQFDKVGETAWGEAHGGMSLRDWFAGRALTGICGDLYADDGAAPEQVADRCYQLADAMLARRAK